MSLFARPAFGALCIILLAGATHAQAADYDSDYVSTSFTREMIKFGPDEIHFTVKSPVYSVTTSIQDQQVSVLDYSCSEDPYTTRAWGGFFETRDPAAKANILKDLISGVGKARSVALVQANTFSGSRPPSTWAEFSEAIKYADAKNRGIYNDVVIKNGGDNRKALGYTTCTQSGSHPETVPVEVKTRSSYPVHNATANVHIKIEGNPTILKGETEIFSVSFNGAENDAKFNITSEVNAYTVEAAQFYDDTNTFYYKVSGSRLKAQPNNNLDISAWNEGGQLVLQVTNRDFDSATYQRGDIGRPYAHITVKQVNPGVFNKNQTLVDNKDFDLNRDNAVTKIYTGARPGKSTTGTFKKTTIPGQAKASVSMRWSGSAFYGESASTSKDSPTVGGF